MWKNKARPIFNTLTKIKLKWIEHLNLRTEHMKLLEENIGTKFINTLVNVFLNISQKTTSNKFKNKSVGLHQTKKGKKSSTKWRPPGQWEKIFAKLLSVKSLPGVSDRKASAYNAGDPGSVPGSGRSPGEGNGNPRQYSWLENPMDGGAWWATVHGVTKSQTWLSN